MPEITNNTVLSINSTIPDDDRETMIKVENVGMTFNMASEQLNSLKEYAIALFKKNLFFKELRALDNISFEIKKGDVYGILGTNGSGKSTLLKIVAGVLEPTDGKVTINGSIAPLIELGAGFDMELTARENIYLNGALMGYSKEFINEHFDDIVEFAEIDKFLDMPMKNYSSGMVARIAFAIATVIVPEILIVDEVLSVGDFMFQKKCEDRIQKLIKDHGTTVLLVSHSIEQIERMCNKAIWIEKGKTRINGLAEDVCSIYSLIGGRTGSIEAENAILEAYLKTKDIKLENVEDYYYDAWEPSYCDTSLDLVKRATPKGTTFNDLVLVAPFEHVYSALGNSIAGALKCPILPYSDSGLTSSQTEWITAIKPKNIYLLDRTDSKASQKLVNSDFEWSPELTLLGSNCGDSPARWCMGTIDYFTSKNVSFEKKATVVDYEDNVFGTAFFCVESYKKCNPVISFKSDEDDIKELKSWANSRDFSLLMTNIHTDKSSNITAEYPLNKTDIEVSESNPTEVLFLPYVYDLFNEYVPAGYYCCNREAITYIIDNSNLESIAKACEIITTQKIKKVSFVRGITSLTRPIVEFLAQTTKLN